MAKLKELQEFIDSKGGSRGKAEFFVGRKDELALIEKACVQAMKRKMSPVQSDRDNDPGGILFEGAPGTGKSALLMEAADSARIRFAEEKDETGAATELPKLASRIREKLGLDGFGAPLVVSVAPEDMRSERSLLELCAEQAHVLRENTRNRILAAGTTALARQFTKVDVEHLTNELKTIDVLERPLVLLLIDEAQTSTEENKGIYTKLHLGGHQLPTVPVFAGLSDSKAALKNAGISRFAYGHHVQMGALGEEDCKEAMGALLDKYEIAVGRRDGRRWREQAVEQSSLFPYHLNSWLVSAAQTAVEHEGRLNSNLLEIAVAYVEERKRSYYKQQAKDFLPSEREFAAKIIERTIRQEEDPVAVAGNVLVKGLTRSQNSDGSPDQIGFIDRMVHSGMLCEARDGKYECPIPSFANWLITGYGKGSNAAESGAEP